MKLLLKKDIAKLGIVGDIVDVSPGYARNYLLPNQLATEPTEANVKAIAKERALAEERRRQAVEALKAKAETLSTVEVTIAAAATEEGHLYGSVGPREIAAALCELGHDVEPSKVKLPEPIKRLDNVSVPVVLAESIEAMVKVWVVRTGGREGDVLEGDSVERSEQADGTEARADDNGGT
ncbi:MAG: 50S ribosomal protein L9 [Phycisphaerales bacterium]|nr:MAG: 50S ribosomal protein L9 [Phycisphaerales bacterium]